MNEYIASHFERQQNKKQNNNNQRKKKSSKQIIASHFIVSINETQAGTVLSALFSFFQIDGKDEKEWHKWREKKKLT